MFEVFDTEIKW